MSVTVKHLNADATFLLTFQPASIPSPALTSPPGSPNLAPSNSFSILLDPWLIGSSKIYHPKFAISRHRIAPCVASLKDIPTPDVVVISQGKPDHCHEETLRQLPPGGPGDDDDDDGGGPLILAAPAAAKRIRSWRHFHPSRVQSMRPFKPHRHGHPSSSRRKRRGPRPDTLRRIVLPPLTPSGSPGEVTIAFLPEKLDVTGLHTAIGITYRPPTSSTLFPAAFSLASSSSTPPGSPRSFHSSSMSSYAAPTDRPVSLIYSPHGVGYDVIEPYASTHLVAEAALPLTTLLHPLDRVQNPWWLGGNVSVGLPGGLAVARNLMARCWVSAHDEDKEVGGVSTIPIRTRKYGAHEARALLAHGGKGIETDVLVLDPGRELTIRSTDYW